MGTSNAHHTTIPEGIEFQAWPKKNQICTLYNISGQRFAAALRHGHLTTYGCSDGSIRLDPNALKEAYGDPVVTLASDDDDDDPSSSKEVRRATGQAVTMTALLREAVAMLKEARGDRHETLKQAAQDRQATLKLVLDPANAMQAQMLQTMTDMREENAKLRQTWLDAMLEREKLISENQLRALEVQKHTNIERRRDQTLTMFKPHLVGMMQKAGIVPGGASAEQMSALGEVADFVGGLDAGLLRMVIDSDALDAKQVAFLKKHRPDLEGPPKDDPQTVNGAAK